MILKAKINDDLLQQIVECKKTMEFRQFDGTDKMELTGTPSGKTILARIVSADITNDELDGAVRTLHKNVPWVPDEPIFVFKLEVIQPKERK